ncbi:MAG: Dabb family protein [Bacteroidales bacterium]
MVRHIVIWKMLERNPVRLHSDCIEFRSKLLALKGQIPFIHALEVGINSGSAPDGNHDIVLVADFNDFEELKQYQKHPAHQALIEWLRGKRELRAAVDYEI